jgi:hypothetical protein
MAAPPPPPQLSKSQPKKQKWVIEDSSPTWCDRFPFHAACQGFLQQKLLFFFVHSTNYIKLGGNLNGAKSIFESNSNGDILHLIDSDGWSALHYASWYNHLGVVEWLLNQGANSNITTTDTKSTPLHFAAGISSISFVSQTQIYFD